MIRIRELSLLPGQDTDCLRQEAARLLRIPEVQLKQVALVRRSVDARKKPEVRLVYTVDVTVAGREETVLHRSGCRRASLVSIVPYQVPQPARGSSRRPVVVGFGPAGIFAALVLAMAGLKPLVLERGEDALTRQEKVRHFFAGGALDAQSNVQFGEGGAGTFSDGKLNTGLNNPRISWVLEQFVAAGAGEDILMDAKPHIGTDVLVTVVQNLRRRIQSLGGEVRFCTQVTGLRQRSGRLTGLVLADGTVIDCCQAVFAIGHSARDTFQMLLDHQVPMEPKPFAMGARIEHRQADIDCVQYGRERGVLPPADYKLVCHLPERSVYTFCMCPGGYVVAAASEPGGIVTNGMSLSDRGGENANAALLVSVKPSDFPEAGPLGGVVWQRQIEQTAWQAAGGTYRAPAQTVGDFLTGKSSTGPGRVLPTYRPGVTWCDLHAVLPPVLTQAIEQALPVLNRTLPGFAAPDSVLTGPETRSSSPVRIVRDESRQSLLRGLYPTGEGAGYAGGILSAAIDGMLTAEEMIRTWGNCHE